MSLAGQLLGAEAVRAFALAGNARLTLHNPATGIRFTYRVRAPRGTQPSVHFVSLLNGQNNEGDYAYFGYIRGGQFFHGGQKARVGREAASVRAFGWAWSHLDDLKGVEVFHEGRCGRCGRSLTVPESVASGIGPECAGRLGAMRVAS